MTLPEVLLWQHLRKRPGGLRFRRQFPLHGYVVDFACLERRLAIEVDGQAHSMSANPERDSRRDESLNAAGFPVLRIAAVDVLNDLDAVLMHILQHCESRPLHQPPAGSPPRSGEDLS
jgi:very-short-patch-repair endonuclease